MFLLRVTFQSNLNVFNIKNRMCLSDLNTSLRNYMKRSHMGWSKMGIGKPKDFSLWKIMLVIAKSAIDSHNVPFSVSSRNFTAAVFDI